MYFEYWLIITFSLSLSLSRSLFVRLYSLFFISCFCSFLHHLNQLRCIDFCANYLPLPDTLCFAVFSLFCICFVFYFCANASGHQLNLLVQMCITIVLKLLILIRIRCRGSKRQINRAMECFSCICFHICAWRIETEWIVATLE